MEMHVDGLRGGDVVFPAEKSLAEMWVSSYAARWSYVP